VDLLGRKVDRAVRPRGLVRREPLLRSPDRALERRLEPALDPDGVVVERQVLALQEEDPLEEDDVDVFELVEARPVFGRRLVRMIREDARPPPVAERNDEPREHLVEPDRVTVEMLALVLPRETDVREREPPVDIERRDAGARSTEEKGEPLRDPALSRRVDAAQSDEGAPLARDRPADGEDPLGRRFGRRESFGLRGRHVERLLAAGGTRGG